MARNLNPKNPGKGFLKKKDFGSPQGKINPQIVGRITPREEI